MGKTALLATLLLCACSSSGSGSDAAPTPGESTIYGTWDRDAHAYDPVGPFDPPVNSPEVLGLISEPGGEASIRLLVGQASVTMAERIEAAAGQVVTISIQREVAPGRIQAQYNDDRGIDLAIMTYQLVAPNILRVNGRNRFGNARDRRWIAYYNRSPNTRL